MAISFSNGCDRDTRNDVKITIDPGRNPVKWLRMFPDYIEKRDSYQNEGVRIYYQVIQKPEFFNDPEGYLEKWIQKSEERGWENCPYNELEALRRLREIFQV